MVEYTTFSFYDTYLVSVPEKYSPLVPAPVKRCYHCLRAIVIARR
jgi:hypothetical protein